MTIRIATLLVALPILAACADRGDRASRGADEPTYTFTTLEYPGADATVAADVDDDDYVVGWYRQADVVRGFVYHDGEFTSVEYPDAVVTQVTTRGPDGSLGGAYRMAGQPDIAWHGFVRRPSGEFIEVRHPDHPYGMAQRILDDGTILGCYHGNDYTHSMFGITVRDGALTVNEMPGSMNNGGARGGRIVGNLSIEGRGFLADGDRFTLLEAPGSTSTEAWDINEAGTVVGVAVDADGVVHAVVLENGEWTQLDPPGATLAIALGINSRGDVAGAWQDAEGRRRGYIARR